MTATIIPFPGRLKRPVSAWEREQELRRQIDIESAAEGIVARLLKLRAIRGITLQEYDEMKRLEKLGFSLDEQIERIVAARKPRGPGRRR